ncbi:hypothetical protein [Streptomyces sampsonii]|uniref:hypothetical protein n=1 Tax=Streptomyces sampsonii TaxID=42239 RepID=UPI0015A641EF|nr:hypothetical protein [Streptomyces sampsonii]
MCGAAPPPPCAHRRARAEAQRSGDVGGVTVTDAMLAAHAGIVADEEHRQPAPRPLDA